MYDVACATLGIPSVLQIAGYQNMLKRGETFEPFQRWTEITAEI